MSEPPLRLVVFAALAGACGAPGSVDEYASASRPIVHGEADTASAHKAVVAVDVAEKALCSGTLIGPRSVLSAAHCLENSRFPGGFRVGFGADLGSMTWVRAAVRAPHPGWDPETRANDIGILKLAAAPPPGVVPLAPLPARLALKDADVGSPVQFSGYGRTESGSVGARMQVHGTIAMLCPGPAPCVFLDRPVAPRSIAFEEKPGGPCSGDSGGPALLFRDGTEYVAGITSYGDEKCEEMGVSTKVDEFESFLAPYVPTPAPAPKGGCAGAGLTAGHNVRIPCCFSLIGQVCTFRWTQIGRPCRPVV